MNFTPEWITVVLLALGMILGGFAWSISFFASKGQLKAFKEIIEGLKGELKILKDDMQVLFGNTVHYQAVIKKNASTLENVEALFQRIDDKLPAKKKKRA